MPVFISPSSSDLFDSTFWAGLNVSNNSTFDARGVDDAFEITLTASGVSILDTDTGTVTSFTDADLGSGSFSNFVGYRANDAGNNISGSVGLNSFGYVGGDGDDTLTDSGAIGGTIRGGGGDDTLTGGTGNNNISGDAGNDTLIGGGGNDNLNGGDGDDILIGGTSSGNLNGGNGDDTIFVGENTTFVNAGNGNDSLVLPPGATFAPFSPGSSNGLITLANGNTLTYLGVPAAGISVACFAAGTCIRTPTGDVAVEDLVAGQLIDTVDDGPQPLRWVGAHSVPGEGQYSPICFETGTVGNDAPLYVSPQHRMLIDGWHCDLLLGEAEVLCAATHLCDGMTIYRAPCSRVIYYHIMFDRHQIVYSNGARTESFFVGDQHCEADRDTYEELSNLFPDLMDVDHPVHQPARRFLRKFEAVALIAPL
ncbi:MAG: Hint domain-containing protein [Litoreibacter sp.]|uniref:Hint domain-containing protein n=1 Tax=Litoreibacter sp. TaxID=1969459 RepID=UPI0032971CE6